jgi:DNA-directed RNA polymerase specialized sigma24 family protein
MPTGYVIPVDPNQLANRFSSPENEYELDSLDGEDIENIPDDEGYASYVPEEDFESKVAPLLDRIPQREADLIYLYFIQRKKQAEIAQIFEVTQAAISYRLDRGLQRIKFLLSIPQVTEEEIRRDLAPVFEEIDVNILVGMWETTCQSVVAERLDLTQGRVRHRFFNAVKALEKLAEQDEVFKTYAKIFTSISNKRFNILREVKLPQWADRGGDKCF